MQNLILNLYFGVILVIILYLQTVSTSLLLPEEIKINSRYHVLICGIRML